MMYEDFYRALSASIMTWGFGGAELHIIGNTESSFNTALINN